MAEENQSKNNIIVIIGKAQHPFTVETKECHLFDFHNKGNCRGGEQRTLFLTKPTLDLFQSD